MTETNGKIKMTVSGLSNAYMYEDDYVKWCGKEGIAYSHDNWVKKYKYSAIQYIIDHGGLDYFDDGMSIPASHSRRLTHTYSRGEEDYFSIQLTDYTGITAKVEEFYYIHLEPSEFTLSFANEFLEFITGLDNGNITQNRETRPELHINPFQVEYNFYSDGEVTIERKWNEKRFR